MRACLCRKMLNVKCSGVITVFLLHPRINRGQGTVIHPSLGTDPPVTSLLHRRCQKWHNQPEIWSENSRNPGFNPPAKPRMLSRTVGSEWVWRTWTAPGCWSPAWLCFGRAQPAVLCFRGSGNLRRGEAGTTGLAGRPARNFKRLLVPGMSHSNTSGNLPRSN